MTIPWFSLPRFWAPFFALILALGAGLPASAQSLPGTTPAPAPAKVQLLLDLLADPEIAGWIKKQASATSARDEAVEVAGHLVQNWIATARKKAAKLPDAIARLPEESIDSVARFLDRLPGHEIWQAPAVFAIALTAAFAVEWLFWRLTRRFRRRLIEAPQRGLGDRLRILLIRVVAAAFALTLFALVGIPTFASFGWSEIATAIGSLTLIAIVILRALNLVARIVLSPRLPRLRLVPLNDQAASFIYRGLTALFSINIAAGMISAILEGEELMSRTGIAGFDALTGGAAMILGLILVWVGRRQVLRSFAAAGLPRPSFLMIDAWPVLASLLLPLIWMLKNSDATSLASSLDTLLFVPIILVVLRLTLKKLICAPPETAAGEDTPLAETRPYPVALDRLVRAVIVIGMLFSIAADWKVDPLTLADKDDLAARAVNALFLVVAALLIADFIWQMLKAAIDRRIPEIVIGDSDDPGNAAQATRLQTLLPLLRHFIMIVVWMIAALICLSSLGIDIGPLLAGAGIAGIAIGFGTQALVRDVIAGVFFLIDDAFRIGEYIESGEIRGTVEGFSLRSVRLRHHRGHLHTVPFGDLKAITNYSRDWVIEKLEFGVVYDTDLDLVRKVIKKVGQEMLQDPELAKVILEPLKSQGVLSMGEYAINMRAKIKTKPGEQFVVRREAYKRIKLAFDGAGIKFAFPTVAVQGGGDAAAAQAALAKTQAAKA